MNGMRLTRLPTEILIAIVSCSKRADLTSLCLVSKLLYSLVAPILYRSVSLRGASSSRLDRINIHGILSANHRTVPPLLHHTQHLDISFPTVENAVDFQCQHDNVLRIQEITVDDEDGNEIDHGTVERNEMQRCAQRVMSVLEQCQDGTLQSFTWNVGTCVPREILGPQGYLVQKQKGLRSLRLQTSSCCKPHSYRLKHFKALTRLSWTGVAQHAHFLDLRDNLSQTAAQLLELELDCVTWPHVRKNNAKAGTNDGYFATEVLGLRPGQSRVVFPALRRLSLTGVALMGISVPSAPRELADAFSFHSIRSLKLRFCPGWEGFLHRVASTQASMYLQNLQIDDGREHGDGVGHFADLHDFVNAVDGLEEFFYSHAYPTTVGIWRTLVRHRNTLRSLVHHLRGRDDLESGRPCDDPDCMPRNPVDHPALQPLKDLDLEFIGLCVEPEKFKSYVLPFAEKDSLKVFHVRQSADDAQYYGSWGIASPLERPAQGTRRRKLPKLTSTLDELAEWAFGPEGIQSLEILAFGDFSYGDRYAYTHVLLCRQRSLGQRERGRKGPGKIPGKSYRHVLAEDVVEREVIRKYACALQACPTALLSRIKWWNGYHTNP